MQFNKIRLLMDFNRNDSAFITCQINIANIPPSQCVCAEIGQEATKIYRMLRIY